MKKDFCTAVYNETMNEIVKNTGIDKQKKKTDIKITMSGNNRYISLHHYGEDLKIMIYTRGEIVFVFKEECHDPFEVKLFEITDNMEASAFNDFMKQYKGILKLVIKDFLDGKDWHVALDYLHDKEPSDWFLRYKLARDCM